MRKFPPRGYEKLISVTYSDLSKWTGLTVGTVRQYASRGDFNPRDLDSALSWANSRRAKQGEPLIGLGNQVSSKEDSRGQPGSRG